MKRGRPVFSEVRQNILLILAVAGKAYGYELTRFYLDLFPKVTRRLIYYHLHKGVELEEIEIAEVVDERGDYSWGRSAEKTYYKIGKKAKIIKKKRVLEYFNKLKRGKNGVLKRI
jgi:hypothetical protein